MRDQYTKNQFLLIQEFVTTPGMKFGGSDTEWVQLSQSDNEIRSAHIFTYVCVG